MEITTNQSKSGALEGITPTKVSIVTTVKSNAAHVAAQPDVQNTVFSQEGGKEEVGSTDKVEKQDKLQNQAGKLHEAVSQMNDHVQNLQRNLQFTVDDVTGKDVVTVIDKQSEEVIRQIPSEEALELARRLADNRDETVQLFSTIV